MDIQISIFGFIIILVFYGISAGLLMLLWLATRSRRWKWVLIMPLVPLLLALPWVDEVWIAWQFRELCKNAGVHVIRKVEVEGFYEGTIGNANELIDRYGYRFIEQRSLQKGKIERIEKLDGRFHKTVLDRPTARYHHKYADSRQEVPIALKIEKRETIIVDSQSGEVIARDTRYNRYPGWIEGLWVGYVGSGQITCDGSTPKPPELREMLYHYTFTPVAQH